MNKDWSELNKTMQLQLKKKDTFAQGIGTLLGLRKELMTQILKFREQLPVEAFSAMPFPNVKGYHSKSIAYSLWHIFRIEDIVAHTLIAGDEQVFFTGEYQGKIQAPIITTGNELEKEAIGEFSKQLQVDALYEYIADVDKATTEILTRLTYEDCKRKVSQERRQVLEELCVVSKEESACWLIDYWCGKDVRGLLQMPFSRHWIMHIEACRKIRDKVL